MIVMNIKGLDKHVIALITKLDQNGQHNKFQKKGKCFSKCEIYVPRTRPVSCSDAVRQKEKLTRLTRNYNRGNVDL